MFLKKLNFDETNENENANMENINSMHGLEVKIRGFSNFIRAGNCKMFLENGPF